MDIKPFSQACENNKQPIGQVLQTAFKYCHSVLEVGSGTGQHAVYFSSLLPQLQWMTSDVSDNIAGINLWLNECSGENIHRPVELDVDNWPWPTGSVDGIFTANTLHIMSWQSVVNFFTGVGKILNPGGTFCIYGPFNYAGQYTSASNASFDAWLQQQAPHRAIRDIEAITRLAGQAGLELVADHPMPANNRLLEWRKR